MNLLTDIVINIVNDGVVYLAADGVLNVVHDAVVDGIADIVEYHRVDGMVDVGVAVGDGRGHAVVHVVAVLDLVVAQCIHDTVVNLLTDVVHDAVVDGIADKVGDVACVAGRQGVGHGGHGRGVVGDGHRSAPGVVADGGLDVGRRPVDAGPCALIGRHAADHHGEHAVGIGAQPGVRFAIHHIGAGGVAAHIDLHRDVVLVEHQLVLRVTHHRLVGQLLVGWRLRKSKRHSHKEQEDNE